MLEWGTRGSCQAGATLMSDAMDEDSVEAQEIAGGGPHAAVGADGAAKCAFWPVDHEGGGIFEGVVALSDVVHARWRGPQECPVESERGKDAGLYDVGLGLASECM